MKRTFILQIICLCVFVISYSACEKDWLEVKRDLNLVVPESLEDMQRLMRNTRVFMYDGVGTAIFAADEHHVDDATLARFMQRARRAYMWRQDMFQGELVVPDWNRSYQQIAYCNLVLENLEKLAPTLSQRYAWDEVKGAALFFRGKAFFNLAQIFAHPWPLNGAVAGKQGIPLLLKADVNAQVTIPSLEETYRQIEEDLKGAAYLLDISVPQLTDPSKRTSWAMLARLNLVMGRYNEALAYTDSCLTGPYQLLDLNALNSGVAFPFSRFNSEVLLHSLSDPNSAPTVNAQQLDLYRDGDLRRSFFFREAAPGLYSFRGNYSGTSEVFTGIAVDEIVLIRAECLARQGRTDDALRTLEELLASRYREEAYVMDYGLTDLEALRLILRERRNELIFRGLRWSDLRRLNQHPDTETTIERYVDGVRHVLMPGDPRYTLPIPDYVMYERSPDNLD